MSRPLPVVGWILGVGRFLIPSSLLGNSLIVSGLIGAGGLVLALYAETAQTGEYPSSPRLNWSTS